MSYQHIMTDELVALDLGEVGSSLSLFASEIRKIFPRCSFAWQNNGIGADQTILDVGGNLVVYHKNKSVAMGWVHVGSEYVDVKNPHSDDRDRVSKVTHYVGSRKVSNDSRTGSDHYVVKTGNPEVAIRNVKKYFVEYNAVEIAQLNKRNTQSMWRKTLSQMIEDTRRSREEICRAKYTSVPGGGTDPLVAELRVLADTGYKFVDAEFDEKVRALRS